MFSASNGGALFILWSFVKILKTIQALRLSRQTIPAKFLVYRNKLERHNCPFIKNRSQEINRRRWPLPKDLKTIHPCFSLSTKDPV